MSCKLVAACLPPQGERLRRRPCDTLPVVSSVLFSSASAGSFSLAKNLSPALIGRSRIVRIKQSTELRLLLCRSIPLAPCKSPSPHNKSKTSPVKKGAAKTPRQQENLTSRQVECSTCSQLKKDLHNQRLRNISVRDECNKLRARNHKLEEKLTKMKEEIELLFDYSSF